MTMLKRAVLAFAVALLFLGACSSSAAPGNGGAQIQVSAAWLRHSSLQLVIQLTA